ncbi:MAG: AAC(3) family N-acetyltransferase [Ruminococcaceae bacterium]|nr:AAC(3) family N-acetyltransferase [Oscillospiraceae bacterium]
MVTRETVRNAAREAGIKKGDILLVHSSFKSMGEVDGGAESVIGGFLDAIGEEGTLVLPTLCQEDFLNSYKTWHMDKKSDVGYLTNYFRCREGSYRSDQATHSVAASGKMAKWLTETHGHTAKRWGNMGDTPFSPDSPWQKMYDEGAKVLLLGVTPMSITFRHFAEYLFIEECLKSIEKRADYEEMKSRLHCFERYFDLEAWPHIYSPTVFNLLTEKGLTGESKCGNATFKTVPVREYVDTAIELLKQGNGDVLWRVENGWKVEEWLEWYEDCKKEL